MLNITFYSYHDLSKEALGWINPNHIVQMSTLSRNGFAKIVMTNNSVGYVNEEGYNKILDHFIPEVNNETKK